MKKIFFALALLLTIGAVDALAQSNPPLSSKRIRLQGQAAPPTPNPPTGYYNIWVDSATGALNITDSAGTDTPVGAGLSGLNTGRVPQAGSSTTIVDSKVLTSGTNSGTWTLYDSTASAVTGITNLTIREGAAQAASADYTPAFQVFWANGTTRSFAVFPEGNGGYAATIELRYVSNTDAYFRLSQFEGLTFRNVSGAANQGVYWSDGSPGSPDLGLLKHSAGTAKLSDGSTGFGSLRAAALGTETANGAVSNIQTISESITLDTGGTTTDSSADLLPANSIILSVVARVTTTITTATDWNLQDPTTANRFLSPNSTLTAGTTAVGLNHLQGGVATDGAGPVQIAAAKLRIVTTGTPGAGVIRVTVTYLSLTPPTS